MLLDLVLKSSMIALAPLVPCLAWRLIAAIVPGLVTTCRVIRRSRTRSPYP